MLTGKPVPKEALKLAIAPLAQAKAKAPAPPNLLGKSDVVLNLLSMQNTFAALLKSKPPRKLAN